MTGRLWWRRDGSELWGLELDGKLSACTGVELVGATVRTAVARPGETFDLPGGAPRAIIEFEAEAVIVSQPTDLGEMVTEYHRDKPANDNGAEHGAKEQGQ